MLLPGNAKFAVRRKKVFLLCICTDKNGGLALDGECNGSAEAAVCEDVRPIALLRTLTFLVVSPAALKGDGENALRQGDKVVGCGRSVFPL